MDTSGAGSPGGDTADPIERDLGMLQLSDSFFPTGLFATSNGLEYLFSEKRIGGADDLADLLRVSIAQQAGPTDCVAFADAFDSARRGDLDGVVRADGALFATKTIRETRDASTRSGIQLAKCVAEFAGGDGMLARYLACVSEKRARGVFPVALAVCCSALKIEKKRGMTMMLYGFSVAVAGAALRLGMIQHIEAQQIIHRTKPVIARAVRDHSDGSVSDMWQFCPQMDIVQMSHAKMDPKMFIT